MNSLIKAALGGGLALGVVLLLAGSAHAQIKSPGQHSRYSAELEPHLVFQWANNGWWDDDGLGLGFRASIPVIDNGPITTINNNFAVSFGLDWAHFDGCGPYADCGADDFWIPIVAQWNFFLTSAVSVFPELGLAIRHSRWDVGAYTGQCRDFGRGNNVCIDNSDTDIEFVLWMGGRFEVSDSVALTLRLGVPSLLLGVSFLL